MKKFFSLLFFISLVFQIFPQNKDSKIKFIKGNIVDKTKAIKESTGEDSYWLAEKAIQFALDNKEILGNDRELDALVVSAILTITPEYVASADKLSQAEILFNFTKLFNIFSSSNTVQIAVLSKILLLKDSIQTTDFTEELNKYLQSDGIATADKSVLKSVISTLESIGNNKSFNILFSLYINPEFESVQNELETTLIKLAPNYIDEILYIINEKDIAKNKPLFEKIVKNSKISKNNLCEIAENLLNSSILYVENSTEKDDFTKLQIEVLQVLSSNNWTRASSSAISFFIFAKDKFTNGLISEEDMIKIVSSLINVAPIESISPLVSYLVELNSLTEMGKSVSIPVVEAVIKTLGAIGNKSAFDSLLGVTYLNYPESVLSAAREALAGLKW
ncbi:MAG: hypothetical protein IJ937_01765 [Treponema sp.]|nr:hypothetical protein [Treponema sp.]